MVKSKVRIKGTINKIKVFPTTWINPKTLFESYPDPKNSLLGPQKVRNDPKIKWKSKVIVEENIENKSYSTI